MFVTFLADIAHVIARFVVGAGVVVSTTVLAVSGMFRLRGAWTSTVAHTLSMASRCLLPVIFVVGPIGAMLAMQSVGLTKIFSAERFLSPLIAAAVVRELAPGYCAVMVCFQAGAGIAAELGTMRVQEELDALEVMGVDPRAVVVGPRVLAAALATPILNVVAIVVGILAAYLVAVLIYDVEHGTFVQNLFSGLTPRDVWLSEGKCVVFGVILGSVSATFGFHARGGPVGVGLATNRAVVASVILVLVTNYLLNTAVLGLQSGSVIR